MHVTGFAGHVLADNGRVVAGRIAQVGECHPQLRPRRSIHVTRAAQSESHIARLVSCHGEREEICHVSSIVYSHSLAKEETLLELVAEALRPVVDPAANIKNQYR